MVYFCPLSASDTEISSGCRRELVFGLRAPWTQILSLSTAATLPQPSNPPTLQPSNHHHHPLLIPSPPLCGRPQLQGIPLHPRPCLPNEEWHASGGSDPVWSCGRRLLCFVSHYWLAVARSLTPSRPDEMMRAPLYPGGAAPGWQQQGQQGGTGNCMELWRPNCLYSWAVWLILGGKWGALIVFLYEESLREGRQACVCDSVYICVCGCWPRVCGRAPSGEISDWQVHRASTRTPANISLGIIHRVFFVLFDSSCASVHDPSHITPPTHHPFKQSQTWTCKNVLLNVQIF